MSISLCIDSDQALAFSFGKGIIKARVFSSHPRNIISSAIPPSPSSFRRDAASGRNIGSSWPACGRNCKCNAISTDAVARCTNDFVSSVSRTAVAMSSMQPSVPDFISGSRSTSGCFAPGILWVV